MEGQTTPQCAFAPGDRVRRRSNTSQVGTVVDAIWNEPLDTFMVQVRIANSVRGYPTFELQRLEPGGSDLWKDFSSNEVGDARAFKLLMATERLRVLPAPLGGRYIPARARFVPHQFKPLLKLLEHPSPRFLIADADGLGKTMAAGYILKEWLERRAAQHILVVVPLGQRLRWSHELKRRFEIPLELAGGKDLRSRLQSVKRGWEMAPFLWVIAYEALEAPEVAELLDAMRPNLDLVLLDEAEQAHAGTESRRRAIEALSHMSDALIALCGTPVRSRPEELFELLELLEPHRTAASADIQGLMATAQVSGQVAEHLLAGQAQLACEALDMLAAHPSSGPLQADALFQAVKGRLQEAHPLELEGKLALLRALEGLQPTTAMMSRTRIAPSFEAHASRVLLPIALPATDLELILFQALETATLLLHSAAGEGLEQAVFTAYSLALSCLPAGVNYLVETLKQPMLWVGGEGSLVETDIERELAHDVDRRWEPDEVTRRRVLDALEPALSEGSEVLQDARLETLAHALTTLWQEDLEAGRPERRVVIFSRHGRTLRHLAQQLHPSSAQTGFQTRLLSSGLSLEEQQIRVNQWVTDPHCRVLVCSDAGGVGLDLQAASLVVHYDLPWDPRALELRMARVDRPGQTQDRLLTLTLTTEGGLEHRALLPLYQGLGLFEHPRRALEGAIEAREVIDYLLQAMQPSTDQAALQALLQGAVARGLARVEARLQAAEQAEPLYPADAALTLGLEFLLQRERWPGAAEVRFVMLHTLATHFPGTRLDGDPMRGVGQLDLTQAAVKAFRAWAAGQDLPTRTLADSLGHAPLPVTLEPEIAAIEPSASLLQPGHPIVRFAQEQLEPVLPWLGRAFSVQARSAEYAPGDWALCVFRLRLGPPKEGHQLEVLAWHPDSGTQLEGDAAEDLFRMLLRQAEKLEDPTLPEGWREAAAQRLRAARKQRIHLLRREVQAIEAPRLLRRRRRLEAAALKRVESVQKEVDELRRRNGDPNAIRAAALRLQARRTMLEALRKVPLTQWPDDLEASTLAVVHLKVVPTSP